MTDDLAELEAALRGRYTVLRRIGEGGMAVVYAARDERHHRTVALKLLHAELIRGLGVERFSREIEIAAQLSHPHILPLLDSGTVRLGPREVETPYYVMPMVEGESLRMRLDRDKVVPLGEALRLAREVADALDYAHRRGVVHRDIKPENVLLAEGHAVVADFGLARAIGESSSATLTQAGQTLGTPQYMSPEQITGEGEVDGRADQYALACMLFEMLTGQAPGAQGGSVQSLLARRLAEPPPRARLVNPAVPPVVDETIRRALAVDRADRFTSSAEFAGALEAASPSGSYPMRRPGRGVRVVVGVVIALGLVIGLFAKVRAGRADAITSLAIAPDAPDSATVFLSEGVQDAVADLLRRLPQLRVTAPSLVAQLRRQNPALTVADLGERLKVKAMLTWSLERQGDSVALKAELLRIPGGDLLWSGRYRGPMDSLLSFQGTIAKTITESLRVPLTGADSATFARRPTASYAAYEAYLRARGYVNRAGAQDARNAEAMLDSVYRYAHEAIARDSNFAAAYALLSSYYFLGSIRGIKQPFAPLMDSAMVLATRTLVLDSTLADPWESRVTHALYLGDDWAAAEEALRKGRRLVPNAATLMHWEAIYHAEIDGRLDTALTLSRRAVDLLPNNMNLNTEGDLLMRAGRYDSAVAVLRRAIEADSSVPGPWQRLITSYERLGRYDDAVAARTRWQGKDAAAPFAKGLAEQGAPGYRRALEAGLRAQIQALIHQDTVVRVFPRDTLPKIRETKIAEAYGLLGDWKSAMDWVIREHELRPRRLRFWLTNPDMAGLRNDPRLLPLARQEGLEGLLRLR